MPLQFVREFLSYFRAMGYPLLRASDYPRVDTFLQSLKSEGVETESSRFSIGESPPPHPAPNGPTPPPSYTATTSYSLKLGRIDRLNAVIGELASSGILEMRTASFRMTV